MKGNAALITFIAVLSVISGYLMSKASFIGKAGMSLFYREYNFLKTWWKGGLLIFLSLLLLYGIHRFIQNRYYPGKAKTMHILSCILAMIGLYFTYNDFRHTLSHRLLGERFHLGAYLFWIGWVVISCYYYLRPPNSHNDKELSVTIK
ncbi:MAG: cytochrome d ubiquinol oxidase subunit II [Chitinophagaceae bacterium]